MSLFNPLSFVTTNADQHVGNVGIKERSRDVRITFINGMTTTHESCVLTATKIAQTHGFNKVHFVFDPSDGFVRDLYGAAKMLFFNSERESVAKLVQLWQRLFVEMGGDDNPNGQIIHYAHSRGGLVTQQALKQLTDDQRAKMVIRSFGSPAILDPYEVPNSENIINTSDMIPFTNPVRWVQGIGLSDFNGNDQFIYSENLVWDHSIVFGPSYPREVEKYGEQFLESQLIKT